MKDWVKQNKSFLADKDLMYYNPDECLRIETEIEVLEAVLK